LLLMAPRAIGLGASQLTFLVATALLSGQPPGSLTAFTFGFTLFQIPFGVIGVPIGVVALPSLSRDLARGDVDRYLMLLTRSLRLILFVMLPIVGLTMVLRTQVVTLVFDWGRFSAAGVAGTATALLYLIVALPSESLTAILARAFYASRDTVTPVLAAVVAVAINTTFAIVAIGALGLAAVAIGIVLGSWVEAAFLVLVLRRRRSGFAARDVVVGAPPMIVASVVAAAVAALVLGAGQVTFGMDPPKIGILVQLVAATGAGGLAYLAVTRLFRVAEVATLFELAVAAVRREPAE
jgi:putative peptidoglycan lipid II flippase